MCNIKITKMQIILILLLIFETIITKLLAYTILPMKYFYDSLVIMKLMENGIADSTYMATSQFYKFINIFGINTHEGWAGFLAPIGMIFVIGIVLKKKKYTVANIIFLLATVFFLNIYVFGISKDFIQYLFFILIFLILRSNLTNSSKLFLICLTLIIEALNYRIYYGIMAILVITNYFIYRWVKKGRTKLKKVILLAIGIFFIEMFIISLLSPKSYDSIIYARFGVNIYRENSLDATTIINDLLGENKNFIIFVGNYIINFFRMLFPIELIFKGVKYVPFIIYQWYITVNLLYSLKNIDDKNCLWIFTFLSFFMMSVIFEPDFGSFIRHESAIFLILQYLIYNICDSRSHKYIEII